MAPSTSLIFFLFYPENNIPAVYNKSKNLANEEHRVFSYDCVGKNHHGSSKADQPESYRQERCFPFFHIYPLKYKTESEDKLTGDTPDHEEGRDVLVCYDCTEIIFVTSCQPDDCQQWEKNGSDADRSRDFIPEPLEMEVSYINAIGDGLTKNYCKIIT